ncbi:GNAT family N-acetyltransferase [Actinotalea sp. BY-33]|uniref:GNAT family N-acetyltransferase n=1 Tax=Actinotalea soli TaxID=2819234 RepID=A0A939LRE3_9CELL|nr:GNAT family N-acetyltransferase [Actinotalea soli]MBO1753327.1 GNAT family N-acetyltransferase [Actinotalea soli]
MALFREQADVSVRPAVAEDDTAIARVQLEAWRAHHAAVLGPEVLDQLDVAAVRAQWTRAITQPPSTAHHVLVACDGAEVVGFASSAPAEDGVEVLALEVLPGRQRGGHGSRLLTACVDLAREHGAVHLQTWVLDEDEAREQFLGSAGLGADGAQRSLGISAGPDGLTRTVQEHRWVAEI